MKIIMNIKRKIRENKRIRDWIKNKFDVYDIEDLRIGGNCGCCGAWVENKIVTKDWPWTLCSKCLETGKTDDMVKQKRKQNGL